MWRRCITDKTLKYLSVCAYKVHPTKEFFVVAEKGNWPNIIVYEYPSLKPYRILRGKYGRMLLTFTFTFITLDAYVVMFVCL